TRRSRTGRPLRGGTRVVVGDRVRPSTTEAGNAPEALRFTDRSRRLGRVQALVRAQARNPPRARRRSRSAQVSPPMKRRGNDDTEPMGPPIDNVTDPGPAPAFDPNHPPPPPTEAEV